jgi:hypothetical protein
MIYEQKLYKESSNKKNPQTKTSKKSNKKIKKIQQKNQKKNPPVSVFVKGEVAEIEKKWDVHLAF